jgi:hypothetical protein
MKWYRIITALFLACLLSNCAAIRPSKDLTVTPVERTDAVHDLLSKLRSQNETLLNFKGIGNITVKQDDLIQFDQRVAWIGAKPVNFSMAVLISGYPAVKLATDGEWLYYLEVRGQDTRFKKIAASDPDLERIISIPISIRDVITLVSGRVPLLEFDSIRFVEERPDRGPVLVLVDNWWGTRQKIFYDSSLSQVQRVDVFNRAGLLQYRAEVLSTQRINSYRVPRQLRLSSSKGIDFQLDIHRYWANVELPPDVFVLTPPE